MVKMYRMMRYKLMKGTVKKLEYACDERYVEAIENICFRVAIYGKGM
jgi:hypothetical protein